MPQNAVGAFVAKAMISAPISAISRFGLDGLVNWLSQRAEDEGLRYGPEERKRIRELLSDRLSFWTVLRASITPTRRRGILIVGPSGAGKTALANYLTGRPVIQPKWSTARLTKTRGQFSARHVRIIDTPGAPSQALIEDETYRPLAEARGSILVMVFCYGLLDTVGIPVRPGEATSSGLDEERQWLTDALKLSPPSTSKFNYMMVVVNKMDHWSSPTFRNPASNNQAEATEEEIASEDSLVQDRLSYYHSSAPIREAAKKWCIDGATPTIHPVSCLYDSIKGRSPSGEMSADASQLTLHILRAQIRGRLNGV